MTTRAQAKEETRARLLDAARSALQESGAAAISLREVARHAGVVPSAVYKHVASRDELLTALILEAYGSLAQALEAAGPAWRDAAAALRTWTLAHRHEFQLIYGTPVPGYRAPDQTIPAAARVAAAFVERAGAHRLEDAALVAQLAEPAAGFGADPSVLAATLADLSQLTGLLLLELGGHFVGTADPAEHLWAAVLDRLDPQG